MTPVCVVLVNYKNESKTIDCVQALQKGSVKPQRVYVVDNTPNSSGEKYIPDIQFIFNKNNVGFAAGCNQGIRAALEQGFNGYFWLLNNDTIPSEQALENLLKKAEETKAGVTGSAIYTANGDFSGGVGKIHSRFASVKRPCSTEDQTFDYIEGSSFLISPECLQKIGLLSEDYFLYFEESDYCLKAKRSGFSLAWATDSIIKHDIGSSTGSEHQKGKVPFFTDCLMIRNRIHFAMENGFPLLGVATGLLISLGLRVKRFQFNRVFTIIRILLSQKSFKKFIEDNGGFYELQHESK